MSADLIRQKARERHFLEQLLDGKKLENYKIPVPIKAELRKYQQVGGHMFFGSVASSECCFASVIFTVVWCRCRME